MKYKIQRMIKYVQVTPLHQTLAIMIAAPGTVFSGFKSIEDFCQGDIGSGIGHTLATAASATGLIISEYRASKKLIEYDKLKEHLETHGWNSKAINKGSHSWCHRNMATVASKDVGYEEQTKEYLKSKGYKWFHLLPDK